MSERRVRNIIKKFSDYLRVNSLRSTYERRVILDIIISQGAFFNVDSLRAAIAEAGESISLATLYNTIKLLRQANIIRNQYMADGSRGFELLDSTRQPNKCTTICSVCGASKDVKEGVVLKDQEDFRLGSFHQSYITVTIYGLCSRCARKQRSELTRKRI